MPRPLPVKVFDPGYTDLRDGSERTRERRTAERLQVVRQARHLATLRNDPAAFARSVRLLQVRRANRPDLAEFESVPNDGIAALVVPGELVVRRSDLGDRAVAALVAELGLEPAALPDGEDPTGTLVRLVEVERDRARSRLRGRMAGLAETVRRRGIGAQVSLRYLCPLGGVIKGEGGPEPSVGARPFPGRTRGGGEVVVAVVDTGITAEERTDGWLQGLLGPDNEDVLDAIPTRDFSLDLGAGHGTFVTGVVQQVAPGATVRVLRATDTDGVGTDSQVAAAVLRAAAEGAHVVNLSLGTQTLDDEAPLALRVAFEALARDHPGVVVVAAAGNYGDTRPCWPAALAEDFPGQVVSVGGLTPSGVGAPWSSHGSSVSCSVVGEGVVSTYVIGTEDVAVDDPPDTFGPDSWATWTGTSFAAPQVAGAIARRCAEVPGTTARDAAAWLLGRGTALTGFGAAMTILPGT